MDMDLKEEQRHLMETARRFLEKECAPAVVREIEKSELGFSPDTWRRMADLGWLGLPLPEEYGGFGMGNVDVVVLTKELGRALCPSPYIPTVIIAAGAIAAAGTDEQKQSLLTRIAGGEVVVAFALQEPACDLDLRGVETRATRSASEFLLNGTKMFVECAGGADLLLVTARTGEDVGSKEDGLTMFLVDSKAPGITMTPLPTMARDHQMEVTLRDVEVGGENVLGPVGGASPVLEAVIQRGVVAFCGYMVGAAEKMHELATGYAKDRVQFGRPIGSFQVIQGYLAQLITEIWGAEMITYYAACALDEGTPVRDLVAMAKAFTGDTLKRTTDIGSQIFGGIGYMEEVDTTLYLRRGKQCQLSMGDSGYWEDVVAEEILDKRRWLP
jgi:alkylation response protein AidB-like acyl-CoA dehydrogenase